MVAFYHQAGSVVCYVMSHSHPPLCTLCSARVGLAWPAFLLVFVLRTATFVLLLLQMWQGQLFGGIPAGREERGGKD